MNMFNMRVVLLTAILAYAFASDPIYPRNKAESDVNTAPVLDPRFAFDPIYPRNRAEPDVNTAPVLERRQAIWYTDPEFASKHGVETQRFTEVVEMSRHSHLVARQRKPPRRKKTDKNIFNRMCLRELGESGPSITHYDVVVPIDGPTQNVATPGGGAVQIIAERYIDENDEQEKMDMSIMNNSQCELNINFSTPLRFMNNRRNDPGNALPAVDIRPTPSRQWYDTPSFCHLDDIEPALERTHIAMRLMLKTFYC